MLYLEKHQNRSFFKPEGAKKAIMFWFYPDQATGLVFFFLSSNRFCW